MITSVSVLICKPRPNWVRFRHIFFDGLRSPLGMTIDSRRRSVKLDITPAPCVALRPSALAIVEQRGQVTKMFPR
jgi:hypothetical protein